LSVMKPYLMTIVILLILVHKTSALKKSKTQPTIKCQQGYGICRERCRHDETETHFCRNKGKCCIPTQSTALTNVIVNEIDFWVPSSILKATNTGPYHIVSFYLSSFSAFHFHIEGPL
uniref:Beta-defensin n=1 Tax=Ursus maritimus TaxID=29073 RepID=A0A452SZJ1_URSMA